MAVYRSVHVSFWTDPKVTDDFTANDQYFYLYLLTNSHTNIIGCYEVSTEQMRRETKLSKKTIDNLLERFEKVHKVIRYDRETRELLLLNWSRYNWTTSDRLLKAVSASIQYVRSAEFKAYIAKTFESFKTKGGEKNNKSYSVSEIEESTMSNFLRATESVCG